MKAMERHEHGVVEVAMRLVAAHRGTGDGISREEREELERWLAERIDTGWTPSKMSERTFDACVRALAAAALDEASP